MSGWIVRLFAMAGPSSAIGAAVGAGVWFLLPKEPCDFPAEVCIEKQELLGWTSTSAVTTVIAFAAIGGVVGLLVKLVRVGLDIRRELRTPAPPTPPPPPPPVVGP